MKNLGFQADYHNHNECIEEALHEAEQVCRKRNTRLTDTRRKVLELIWEKHEPVKAYDILERLSSPFHKVKPPTVYRALEFLLENGLIHRIESLNAYIGCPNPEMKHSGEFFICEKCSHAQEVNLQAFDRSVRQSADLMGFEIKDKTVEVHGVCRQCQQKEQSLH